MKPTARLRSFLCIASSALLTISSSQADTLYWDGTTSTANPDGGNGTWDDLTTFNWDSSPFGGANTQWDGTLNSAFFGGVPGTGGAGTVSLAAGGITTGGITFNITGYTIQSNTLTFGGTNNTVTLNNSATAAAINSAIGTSAANMTFTAQNPLANHTLTFGGAGNWTGTTTINAGMTLALASTGTTAVNALAGTTGITINGGTITANRNTGGNAQDQISSAAITFNGGGTMNFTNGIGGSFTEMIGAVTVGSGQANFVHTNGSSGSGVVTTLGGLGRTATTAAVTFGNANSAQTSFRVSSGATDTATDQIIGPWATFGTAVATQTDYAIYTGTNGTVAARNITATAASTWSTSWVDTSNYTLTNGSGSAANGLLANSVKVNTVRNTTTATGVTATNGTDVINLTAHGFSANDVVVFGGTTVPTGLNFGQPYYVINTTADTFQVSTTSGGGAALFSADGASVNIIGGITLPSGMSLGTNGILNGSAAALAIGGNGGTITLPDTVPVAGNLFVTAGNAQIQIDAPIMNNTSTGVLTLVKSGNAALTLRGTNTFTGGIVVNAGSVVVTPTAANGFVTGAAGGDIINGGNLTYSSTNAWGVTGRNVTFSGTGSLTSGAYTGGTLTVISGANAQLSNSAALAFATTTGTGTIINTPSANTLLNLGNASGFTGNVQNRGSSGGTTTGIQFSSLGDGGALQFAGGNSDGGQAATFTYNGTGTLTFNTRQIQILDRLASNWEFRDNTLANNSANGGNNWIINTDLLVSGGRWITAFSGSAETGRLLILSGSNTADNAFNGVISNGTNPNGIGLSKTGVGTWILGGVGTNTYTGATTISTGTLVGVGANAFGSTSGISMAAAGTLSLRGDSSTSFVKASDSSPYTVTTSASAATLNVDQATIAGTGAKTMTFGDITTSSTAGTYQLNFTGANDTSLSAGTLKTPISTVAAVHTINNTIAGGGSLTLASVFNQATTIASPNLVFAGTGNTTVTGAITQTLADMDLIKNDAGTTTLSGANTYTGTTTVSGGTLTLGVDDCLSNSSNVVIANATLNLSANVKDTAGTLDVTNAASKINLGSGATLAFADSSAVSWTGGALNITGIFSSGSSIRFGTTSGGLLPAQLAVISVNGTGVGTYTLNGSGFLVSPGGNTYNDWLGLNGPATGFTTDSDNDGLPNGVENVLGSNPNTFNTGLTEVSATASSVVFNHTLNPTVASDVSYSYEWSTDMVEWKTTGQTNTGGTTATLAASAPVSGVVTVTVMITGGPAAKLFGRLVAVQ